MSDFAEVQTLEKFLIDYDVQLEIPQLQREFVWNESKYWALLETEKNNAVIEEIKLKSLQFLSILNPKQ